MAMERAIAFSTGGLEETDSTSGSPTLLSSPFSTTTYAAQITGSGNDFGIDTAASDEDYILTAFKIYPENASSSAKITIENLSIKLANGSNQSDISYSGTPQTTQNGIGLSTTTESTVVIYCRISATAPICKVWVDGSLQMSTSASGDVTSASTPINVVFGSDQAAGNSYTVSEIYIKSSSTDFESSANLEGYDVYEMSVSGTGYTSSGDALDSGSWGSIGDQPLTAANYARYTGTPLAGHAVCDGTVLAGPSGLGITGTIVGAEWWVWAFRGSGGATTHNFRYGKHGGTVQTLGLTLDTSSTGHFVVSEDTSNVVPSSSEYAIIGMEVDGDRNITIAESFVKLVVEISSSGTNVSVTGVQGTAGIGSLSQQISSAATLTGVQGSGGVGSLAFLYDYNQIISGVEGSGVIGDLNVFAGISVSITGVEGNGQIGTIQSNFDYAYEILGVNGSGQIGSLSYAISSDVTLSGAQGAGQIGSLIAQIADDQIVPISGVFGSGEIGIVTISGLGTDSTVFIESVEGFGEIGSLSFIPFELIGVEGSGEVGTIVLTGDLSNWHYVNWANSDSSPGFWADVNSSDPTWN